MYAVKPRSYFEFQQGRDRELSQFSHEHCMTMGGLAVTYQQRGNPIQLHNDVSDQTHKSYIGAIRFMVESSQSARRLLTRKDRETYQAILEMSSDVGINEAVNNTYTNRDSENLSQYMVLSALDRTIQDRVLHSAAENGAAAALRTYTELWEGRPEVERAILSGMDGAIFSWAHLDASIRGKEWTVKNDPNIKMASSGYAQSAIVASLDIHTPRLGKMQNIVPIKTPAPGKLMSVVQNALGLFVR